MQCLRSFINWGDLTAFLAKSLSSIVELWSFSAVFSAFRTEYPSSIIAFSITARSISALVCWSRIRSNFAQASIRTSPTRKESRALGFRKSTDWGSFSSATSVEYDSDFSPWSLPRREETSITSFIPSFFSSAFFENQFNVYSWIFKLTSVSILLFVRSSFPLLASFASWTDHEFGG